MFADWLEDRGDPRAAGYRAIAAQRLRPLQGRNRGAEVWWWHGSPRASRGPFHNVVPADWFARLPPGVGTAQFWPAFSIEGASRTRRGCEDALALAADRQNDLLASVADPAPPRG